MISDHVRAFIDEHKKPSIVFSARMLNYYRAIYDRGEALEIALVDLITDLMLYAHTLSVDELDYDNNDNLFTRVIDSVTRHFEAEHTP